MKETERIKAGLLFRPNSMELRDTKHKAHETCRLVNTLDEYDERIPGLMRSILGSDRGAVLLPDAGAVQLWHPHLHRGGFLRELQLLRAG